MSHQNRYGECKVLIEIILNAIPVIGVLLSLIVAPYLSIMGGRYYSLIYDAAD